ncbi:MAG TPA: PAS domain-containing protein, partial [Gemmatimonadales bacterium]
MQTSQPALSEFLEALPDPALVLDRSVTIRLANPLAHSLFGYHPGELTARPFHTIVPAFNRGLLGQFTHPGHVTQSLGSNGVGCSCSARRKSGREFRVEIRSRPIFVEDESFTLCILRNANEPEAANAPTWQTIERHRRTLDQMLEGCQIIGADWRYLYVNDAVCRQGKKTQEELLSRTMMEAYPGIEATPVFAALRRCMQEQRPVAFENEFTYSDGTTGWFELSIQPVPEGVLVLSIDITARKQAEREKERQLSNLKALREIDLAIIGSSDVNVALKTVLHEVTAQLAVDAADILLLNPHSQMLEYAAGRGFRSREIERTTLRPGQGIAGRAALEQRPYTITDLTQAHHFLREWLVSREAFVAYHALPLV